MLNLLATVFLLGSPVAAKKCDRHVLFLRITEKLGPKEYLGMEPGGSMPGGIPVPPAPWIFRTRVLNRFHGHEQGWYWFCKESQHWEKYTVDGFEQKMLVITEAPPEK